MTTSYLFGPVASRRLGRSLGIDLLPFKTCPYDCLYCECGFTTHKTMEPTEWAPLNQVLKELKEALSLKPDFITIAGSGEPTLYSKLGELIQQIKGMTSIPVAVLTNGSTLWKPEVREALREADVVMPTLAAGSEAIFRKIHRPQSEMTLEKLVRGLVDFRATFRNQFWLEIFLIEGINTTSEEIASMALIAERAAPDQILLNTVDRPPADRGIEAVPKEKLNEYVKFFGEKAKVISSGSRPSQEIARDADVSQILSLLKRRPGTLEEISAGLGMQKYKVKACLDELLLKHQISLIRKDSLDYYRPVE